MQRSIAFNWLASKAVVLGIMVTFLAHNLSYALSSAPKAATNVPASSPTLTNTSWYSPKGDCRTDDTGAIQSMLNTQRWVYLDKPAGGCYLISKTLILLPGDYLFGASANNPNIADPSAGVVIRLAPNSNVPILRTFDALQPQGGGNEFMGVENIVFDGNGSAQSSEMGPQDALVDYRGTFIQTFLRHVLIINSFGTALFTGSTQLDNVWIFGTSTSSYAWINNPVTTGLGALSVNQVYVEETTRPGSGKYQSSFPTAVNDPSTYGHAIWLNGLQTGTFNQVHCESAATCIDFNDVQTLTIHGISGSRIGNPTSSNPTDQYLMRALNLNIDSFTFSAAYFDQSGTAYNGAFTNSRIFGLAPGLDNMDLYETPMGKIICPFYTWGRWSLGHTSVPYLGERPVVSNELWIEQKGQYSPNRLAIFDQNGGPAGSYAYFERNGNHLNLGFSPGPWNSSEQTMLQMNFFGANSPANSVEVPEGRLITGQQTNTDLTGEVVMNSATAQVVNLTGDYAVHPECNVTPQFDIGAANRAWIVYSTPTSFEIHTAQPVQGSFSYVCIGRQ